MPDHAAFEILDWDSAKFGFRVARIHEAISPANLSEVVRRLVEDDVGLAYYSILDVADRRADAIVLELGATFVDTRVTFVRPARTVESHLSVEASLAAASAELTVRSYRRRVAEPALIDLARQAGAYSRFRLDPRVDVSVFHAIYDAWLIRSVRREIADEVFVAMLESRPVGLLTLSRGASRDTIGLLAVDRSVRGRGLGRRLADLAVAWSEALGRPTQVATQLANSAACALYESVGFEVETRQRTYHLWLR